MTQPQVHHLWREGGRRCGSSQLQALPSGSCPSSPRANAVLHLVPNVGVRTCRCCSRCGGLVHGILHQEALTGATSIPSGQQCHKCPSPCVGPGWGVCAELCCNEVRKFMSLIAPPGQCQSLFALQRLLCSLLSSTGLRGGLLRGQSEPL